jgi:hypothetical protein
MTYLCGTRGMIATTAGPYGKAISLIVRRPVQSGEAGLLGPRPPRMTVDEADKVHPGWDVGEFGPMAQIFECNE